MLTLYRVNTFGSSAIQKNVLVQSILADVVTRNPSTTDPSFPNRVVSSARLTLACYYFILMPFHQEDKVSYILVHEHYVLVTCHIYYISKHWEPFHCVCMNKIEVAPIRMCFFWFLINQGDSISKLFFSYALYKQIYNIFTTYIHIVKLEHS